MAICMAWRERAQEGRDGRSGWILKLGSARDGGVDIFEPR